RHHTRPGELVAPADDNGVRARVRPQDIQRARRRDADALALPGRERPVAVMRAELRSGGVDDHALARREAVAREEVAVVVAGEEAGLLALRATGDVEAGTRRLVARRLLVLLAEREPDAAELARIDACEHVRLVLAR